MSETIKPVGEVRAMPLLEEDFEYSVHLFYHVYTPVAGDRLFAAADMQKVIDWGMEQHKALAYSKRQSGTNTILDKALAMPLPILSEE